MGEAIDSLHSISAGDLEGLFASLVSHHKIRALPIMKELLKYSELGKKLEAVMSSIAAALKNPPSPQLRKQYLSFVAPHFTASELINKYGFPKFSDSTKFAACEHAASSGGSLPAPKKPTRVVPTATVEAVKSHYLKNTHPSSNRTVKISTSELPKSHSSNPSQSSSPSSSSSASSSPSPSASSVSSSHSVVNRSTWKLNDNTLSRIGLALKACKIVSVNESGSCQFAAVGELLPNRQSHELVRSEVVEWLNQNREYTLVCIYLLVQNVSSHFCMCRAMANASSLFSIPPLMPISLPCGLQSHLAMSLHSLSVHTSTPFVSVPSLMHLRIMTANTHPFTLTTPLPPYTQSHLPTYQSDTTLHVSPLSQTSALPLTARSPRTMTHTHALPSDKQSKLSQCAFLTRLLLPSTKTSLTKIPPCPSRNRNSTRLHRHSASARDAKLVWLIIT